MFAHDPKLHLGLSEICPGKWSFGIGLVHTINFQGIMRRSSAELITPRAVDVCTRPRIDQQISAFAVHAHAKRVGMAVPRRCRTLRSGINYELRRVLPVCHQVQASGLEGDRSWRRLGSRQTVKLSHTVQPLQPQSLLTNFPRQELKVSTAEQNSPGSQRVQQGFCTISLPIEQAPAVVIAKSWRRTCPAE